MSGIGEAVGALVEFVADLVGNAKRGKSQLSRAGAYVWLGFIGIFALVVVLALLKSL